MKDVNKVILMGRLGKDPVVRMTNEGTSVVRMSLATSRRVPTREPLDETPNGALGARLEAGVGQAQDGKSAKGLNGAEWIEETQWHNLVVWGKLAGICGQYLKKGAPIFVEGHLKYRKYENSKKETRYAHEIHVEQVSFLPTAGQAAAKSPVALNQSDPLGIADDDLVDDVPSLLDGPEASPVGDGNRSARYEGAVGF